MTTFFLHSTQGRRRMLRREHQASSTDLSTTRRLLDRRLSEAPFVDASVNELNACDSCCRH